jgi:hypothetical protein
MRRGSEHEAASIPWLDMLPEKIVYRVHGLYLAGGGFVG